MVFYENKKIMNHDMMIFNECQAEVDIVNILSLFHLENCLVIVLYYFLHENTSVRTKDGFPRQLHSNGL